MTGREIEKNREDIVVEVVVMIEVTIEVTIEVMEERTKITERTGKVQ